MIDLELQNLAKNSASIKSMTEEDRVKLLASFENLSEEGLRRVKEILLKEQEDEETARKAGILTADDIKGAIEVMHNLEKKFKNLDIKTNQELDQKESEGADAVLDQLDEVFASEQQVKEKKKKKWFGGK